MSSASTQSVHYRVSSSTLKLRRREVEQHLAQFGLRAGPHRLVREVVPSEENKIARLRTALEGLGPVFCSFGLYMSTRVDLLAAKDCLQLASITHHTKEFSPNVVRDHIKREIGCLPEEIYTDFKEKPVASGLLVQQNCSLLHDGLPVTIKLIHPEVEELIHYDVQLLHLLQGAFTSDDCTGSQVESAIHDFVHTLEQHTNFLAHADAVTKLSRDMEVFGMLRVPSVHGQLTTSKILTIERLPGQTLEQILHVPANEYPGYYKQDDERYALAHRLCVVWLRQALLGSIFPAEFTPSNIRILPTNQIAFTGGTLASLPAEAKANVSDYLLAALTDDPDRACSSLLKEMEVRDCAVSEAELRRRFRQFVPFRDSDWAYGSDNNNLPEYLFLHWKLVNRGGYRPRAYMPSLYRGLFKIASISRRLTSKGDPLQHALRDVRVLAETEKLRDMFTVSRFTEQMDAYLALMMHLPQRLDQALSRTRAGLQVQETIKSPRKKNVGSLELALWLMFGAGVLLVQHFVMTLAISRRFETVVFFLFGALLLLLVSRQR